MVDVAAAAGSADDPPEYGYLYGIPAVAFIAGYGVTTTGGYPEVDQLAYLAAALCCIGALTGLSGQKSARVGKPRPPAAKPRPLGAKPRPLGAKPRPLGAGPRPLGAGSHPLGGTVSAIHLAMSPAYSVLSPVDASC